MLTSAFPKSALITAALAAASCRPLQGPATCVIRASTPTPAGGYRNYAHAHNDYEHARPLFDALDAGFHSVEADIWLADNAIRVSHGGGTFKGTLRDLYLDPLRDRVAASGSVLGDGEPFTLWLDLKDGSADLRQALRNLLEAYPMLSRFEDERVEGGPVTAVLTGDAASKAAFVAGPAPRRACRDANAYALDDPDADTRWRYYAIPWSAVAAWNGHGALAEDERHRIGCIVADAHAKGRKVRFYGTPETEAYWAAALDLGVDFLNTDKLIELRAYLDSRP